MTSDLFSMTGLAAGSAGLRPPAVRNDFGGDVAHGSTVGADAVNPRRGRVIEVTRSRVAPLHVYSEAAAHLAPFEPRERRPISRRQ